MNASHTDLEFFDDDYWLSHEDYYSSEQAEADVAEVIGHLGITSGRLLDAPCGTGRIAARLSQLGFEVDGIDLDERALSVARSQQRGFSRQVTYMERDLRDLAGLGPYDAVVSWFNSFGYFSEQDNRTLLETWLSLLPVGGVLLVNTLDLNEVRAVLDEGPLEETVEVRGRMISTCAELRGRRLMTTRVGSGAGPEVRKASSVELFTASEWTTMLGELGFGLTEVMPTIASSRGDAVAEITVKATR